MKHLLLTLSLFLCFNVEAQTRKVYNLETDFGLSWMQGKLQVKNIVTDTVKAKERFPVFYAYRASKGFKGAHFMELSCFDADFGEAGRQGHGGTANAMLNSNNHIIVPSGEYWQTITAEVRGMEVHGAGPGHVAFQDNKNNVNTRLILWHEKWQGDPNERHCMQSSTWNLGKGNTYYSEGMVITGFSFQGRSNEFPTQKFNSSGLRLWFPGEVCSIDQLYCTNFRTAGIEVYGATPLNAGNVSVFDNVIAGVIFYSSGSTVNWDLLSGDDNGSMFACLNGYSDTGGGSINFGTIKNETFVASDGRCHRGMRVGYIEGQATVNIGVVSGYSGSGYTDAAFVIDTRAIPSSGYPPQNISLNVGGFKVKDYHYLVQQLPASGGLTGHYWGTRGNYTGTGFSWDSYNGGVFEFNVSTIPASKVAHACTTAVAFSKTGFPTGCSPSRFLIDGPPRVAAPVYLDATTTPPPTPCTYTYSTWGPCTNGTETRTVVSSTPAGCTGTPVLSQTCTVAPGTWSCTSWGAWSACSNSTQTRVRTCTCTGGTCVDPKPAESESQACTVTPPPTGSAIDPNDVLVVSNSADARTAAWATAYATAWGIPSANVISLNAGTSHDATTTTATAIRTAIQAKVKQYTVLAWEYPSRVGAQSITSLVTFGPRNVSSLTVSPLYNYTGVKPRTDKGVAPSALLVSDKYIRKDADGTRPTGSAYLIHANDQPSICKTKGCADENCSPRGKARRGQTSPGVVVWDNVCNVNVGGGDNDCNSISGGCWIKDNGVSRKPIQPVIANYGSGPSQCCDDANTSGRPAVIWRKGYYGDHLTSFGGYLPITSTGLNSQNQLPLTWHLDRGASFSVGSVSEPSSSLDKQFVNVSIFHPLFMAGKPVGVAAWASVQCPDRMLFAGDLLTAPFK